MSENLLHSRSQRRLLVTLSFTLLITVTLVTFIFYWLTPDARWANTIISYMLSFIASGSFALFSLLYLDYFFVDATKKKEATIVLPKDIRQKIETIAIDGLTYTIYARTGRHFRAEVLPQIMKQAKLKRRKVSIDAILIDLRDTGLCERYASYRSNASFDATKWSRDYVQTEVLATILSLADTAKKYGELAEINLYLSQRLSIFRIEGSAAQLIVTSENPKDIAFCYHKDSQEFNSYWQELEFIKKDATRQSLAGIQHDALAQLINAGSIFTELKEAAAIAQKNGSPYGG